MQCQKCGNKVKTDDVFCSKCGIPLNQTQTIPERQSLTKKKLFSKEGLIVLASGIVIIGCVCAAVVMLNKGNKSETDVDAYQPVIQKTTQAIATADEPSVKPGESSVHNEYDFKFVSAKEIPKVEYSNYMSIVPDKGNMLVVLSFDVQNISSESHKIESSGFSAYVDDYAVDSTSYRKSIDGYEELGGNIASGKKRKGALVYEVKKDWKKLEVYYTESKYFYKDYETPNTYHFEVTPNLLEK